MNAQAIINSAAGVGSALIIARLLPPKLGYLLARTAAGIMASRKGSSLVKSMRANQWIVSGKNLAGPEMDERAKVVLKSTAKCIYEFYHHLENREKVLEMVKVPSKISDYFPPHGKRNALFVSVHISNFDLMGLALSLNGYHFQILSAPDPGSGYQRQNKMRNSWGHTITPTSIESVQQARKRLQSGGNVLTGIDRPVASSKYRPVFFGYPSALPVAYARLASQANVPVVVVSAVTRPDGNYELFVSDPVHMKPMEDKTREILRNAEAVLEVAEDLISKYPEQWSMFYPVWPDQMESI